MTYKRAIAIGLLTSLGIGLLVFGIKTGTFKKENIGKTTTPISYNLNRKRNTPLRVDADAEYQPVSKRWLLNDSLTTETSSKTTYTANYTTGDNISYKNLQYRNSNYGSAYNTNGLWGTKLNSTSSDVFRYQGGNGTRTGWVNFSKRVLTFETEPSGNLLTFLTENAQPIYNNNVVIVDKHTVNTSGDTVTYETCINQIRKNNVILENTSQINQDGTITIYIYQGISTLKINGTSYNNFNDTINLTDKDICIETTGTPNENLVSYIFTINYFHTLPDISPTPIPDASSNIIETLDITGLMFQILTMPFTFISQAFNLTLWEGTPYQFNFSNFILSLIAIATIIFIIKLFTSGFSVIGNYTSHRADTKLKNSQTKLNEAKTKKIESKTPKKE